MIQPTARARSKNSSRRALLCLAACALWLAPAARAASDTDVATALDPDHPLEVDLDVSYSHLRRDTLITQENYQAGKGIILVNALQHTEIDNDMSFRIGIGLYHDLELHIIAPYAIGDDQSWGYASGINAGNSTLQTNTINVSGCNAAGACGPTQPILGAVPGQSQRAGFGDPTIGVTWAPLNEARDIRLSPEIFPIAHPVSTWVVGFDYTLPLPGAVDDPSKFGAVGVTGGNSSVSSSYTGTTLRKAHVFSPWTAFSIRYRVVNPYFSLRATLPLAIQGSAYDNCAHYEILANVAALDCPNSPNAVAADVAAWQGQTGYQPAFTGAFKVGSEFVVAEDPAARQKFAFDLNALVTWYSPARDYSMVSDALGKLTYEDEHVTSIGTFGFYGRIARWLHLKLSASLGFDTPHFLTDENTGTPGSDGVVHFGTATEQNPLYDFRLDQVSRRLHAELTVIWGVSALISANF